MRGAGERAARGAAEALGGWMRSGQLRRGGRRAVVRLVTIVVVATIGAVALVSGPAQAAPVAFSVEEAGTAGWESVAPGAGEAPLVSWVTVRPLEGPRMPFQACAGGGGAVGTSGEEDVECPGEEGLWDRIAGVGGAVLRVVGGTVLAGGVLGAGDAVTGAAAGSATGVADGFTGAVSAGLASVLAAPNGWMGGVMGHSLSWTVRAVHGSLDWVFERVVGDWNFVTGTPEALTVGNETVRDLTSASRAIALALVSLFLVWGAGSAIVKDHIGAGRRYFGIGEVVMRAVLATIAIVFSLEICGVVISLSDQAGNAFQAVGKGLVPADGRPTAASVLPGYASFSEDGGREAEVVGGPGALAVATLLITYVIVGFMLLLQMLKRIALIAVLIVLAPIAAALWVLEQTNSWTQRWLQLFPLTVFQQAVQVAALVLGGMLVAEFLTQPGGGGWIIGVAMSIAVMWLTLKIPGHLQGQALGTGADMMFPVLAARAVMPVLAARGMLPSLPRPGGK